MSFALALLVAGCAGGLAGGMRAGEAGAEAPTLTSRWTLPLYELGPIAWFPQDFGQGIVAEQVLYVGSGDGQVRAVRESGEVLWVAATEEAVLARPVLEGDQLLVGSMDGRLRSLDRRTGDLEWSYDSGGAIRSEVTVSGGRVFFSNERNEIHALDVVTGKYLWHKRRSHRTEFTITGTSAPEVADGKVLVGFSDGAFLALAPEDGTTAYNVTLGDARDRFTDVDTRPVVRDGIVYVASFRGGMHARRLSDGDAIWSQRVEGATTPVLTEDALYFGTSSREVVCLDRATGAIRWRTRFATGMPGAPVLAGRWILVSTDEKLAVLDAATGRIQETWPIQDGIAATPAVGEQGVYVVSNGGALHAWGWAR